MKIAIQLAAFISESTQRRGLVTEIAQKTGIDRHAVTALLNNNARTVSLEGLAKISEYLIEHHDADPSSLPGGLLVRSPERFLEVLAESQQLDFCLATRQSRDWVGSHYVMATDALLQGTILSRSAEFTRLYFRDAQRSKRAGKPGKSRAHPRFHLVAAPSRNATAKDPGAEWPRICARARAVYDLCKNQRKSALIALGSIKVNPVMELMLARLFKAEPFVSQDTVRDPASRSCPVMFRFRDTDPQPPSLCGGTQLAAATRAAAPGIYYETAEQKWEACPWSKTNRDAAFVFYARARATGQADIACGGFSSRATQCLAMKLDEVLSELGEPQFTSNELRVGLYIVQFHFDPATGDYDVYQGNPNFRFEVIAVPEEAVQRRLNG